MKLKFTTRNRGLIAGHQKKVVEIECRETGRTPNVCGIDYKEYEVLEDWSFIDGPHKGKLELRPV